MERDGERQVLPTLRPDAGREITIATAEGSECEEEPASGTGLRRVAEPPPPIPMAPTRPPAPRVPEAA